MNRIQRLFVVLVVPSLMVACGGIWGEVDVPPLGDAAEGPPVDAGDASIPARADGGDSSAADVGADARFDGTIVGDAGQDATGPADAAQDTTLPDAGHDGATTDAALPDSGFDAPFDAGGPDTSDATTCSNACTNGTSACADGGVLTCEKQDGGCTQWVATATCGSHQACLVAGDGGASCSCLATACAGNGTACQPGSSNVLLTCATDSNGCVFITDAGQCPTVGNVCSGSAPNAGCSATCTSTCSLGQQTCVGSQIATCGDAGNGCLGYGTPGGCVDSYKTCTGTPGSASCTCVTDPHCSGAGTICSGASKISCAQDVASGCWYSEAPVICSAGNCYLDAGAATCCSNACTQGNVQCGATGVDTCELQGDGCTAWVETTTCGSHQSCSTSTGSPGCACNNAPGCSVTGETCASNTQIEDCVQDSQGCWVADGGVLSCSVGTCHGSAGAATCCANACTQGATRCASGGVDTCELQSGGCTAWVPTSTCTSPLQCTVAGGTASCTCPYTACPGGACANTNGSDGSNCGACGHACETALGSTCVSGYCTPVTVCTPQAAPFSDQVQSLLVAGGSIFWPSYAGGGDTVESCSVSRVNGPSQANTVTTGGLIDYQIGLAPAGSTGSVLVSLYYSPAPCVGTHCPPPPLPNVLALLTSPTASAIDVTPNFGSATWNGVFTTDPSTSRVFLATTAGLQVLTAPTTSGLVPGACITTADTLTLVAAGGGHVVAYNPTKQLIISASTTNTGCGATTTNFAGVNSGVTALATDGTSVFWDDGTDIYSCAVGATCAYPGTPFAPRQGTVSEFAYDTQNLYWIGSPYLSRCPKSGCGSSGPTVLLLNVTAANTMGLAVDANAAYYLPTDGGVARVAK